MEKVSVLREGEKLCEAKLLDNSLERGLGLMGKRGTVVLKYSGERKVPIHTLFCYPMLIAWINSNGKVLHRKEAEPFNFYSPDVKAKYIFETTRDDLTMKEGESIDFELIK